MSALRCGSTARARRPTFSTACAARRTARMDRRRAASTASVSLEACTVASLPPPLPPSLLHPPPLGSCLPGYAYSPWPSCGRCELGLHASAAARRVGSATCCMGGYVCQFMCATMRAIHARLSQRRVCECAGGGQPPLGSANQAAPPAASPSALWEEARAAAEAPPPTRAAAATTATADRRRPALTSSAIPFAPDALLSSEAEPRPAAESACRETFLCLT